MTLVETLMAAMLTSFTMRLAIDYPGCNTSVPINGITNAVRCYHCGEQLTLDATFWIDAFEPKQFAEAIGFAEGEGRETSVISGHRYRVSCGRRTPRCQGCKGPDLAVDTLAPMVEAGHCFCPGCGHAVALRAADALCRAIHPRSAIVVGEALVDPTVAAKTRPVLVACMNCAGALKVDGSTRTVTCSHCDQANYLPDGLWNQMNPVPRVQTFFLVCDV